MSKTKLNDEYLPAYGSCYGKDKTQVIAHAIEKLKNKSRDGEISKEDVLNANRKSSAPLYEFFEWSNKKAGEKWRLEQARKMITCYTITVISPEGPRQVKANVSIKPVDSSKPKFTSISNALNNPNYESQIMHDFKRDAKTITEKYRMMKKLAPILKTLNDFTNNI